ncbi:MAG TPA: hypothetical protein VGQ83_42985, partial [Polyangia bacterium]
MGGRGRRGTSGVRAALVLLALGLSARVLADGDPAARAGGGAATAAPRRGAPVGDAAAAAARMPRDNGPLTAPGELVAPARLAIGAAGEIYVTEPGRGVVVTFDATGRRIGAATVGGRPAGVAVGLNGDLYVGDL